MGLTEKIFGRGRPTQPSRRGVTAEEAFAETLDAVIEREVLANLALRVWMDLSTTFREDEYDFEKAHFKAVSEPVMARVTALSATQAPDLGLSRALLFVVASVLRERIGGLTERIDDLSATCGERDQELNVLKLSGSWQTDELERCRTMITDALRCRETVMPSAGADGMPPLVSELLAALLNVQRLPPRPEAHAGRRQTQPSPAPDATRETAPASADDGETAVVRRALREVLDGTSAPGRLIRALEDRDLAERIAGLAAENRRYRDTLVRIGLLPREETG